MISDSDLDEAKRQLELGGKKTQEAKKMISDADVLLKESGNHYANAAILLKDD